MSKLEIKRTTDVTGYGTTFGAQTGPRTIGDVLGDTGDMIPLYRGGVMVTEVTAEDEEA